MSIWLKDAGIPARIVDEVMGHEATAWARQHQGSAIGAYRHTTVEMAGRVAEATESLWLVELRGFGPLT